MRKKEPNILWLMSDQHNANCMGVSGHPDVRTPNLDSIASRGIVFSRAYCNNPICAPSRCTFLSGQYVKTHGISGNVVHDQMTVSGPNLGRLFKQNGYETALVGKAHMPLQWIQDGFETIRLSDLCDADWDDPTTCHYFKDLVEAGLADQYDQGLLSPDHPGYRKGSFVSDLPEEYSLEAWAGRKAVEFLQQRDPDKPFFLKVSFQRPHDPYAPPANRMNEYDPQSLHLPDNVNDYLENRFAGKPQFQQDYVNAGTGGYPYRSDNEGELRRTMAAYFTLITMIDESIGKVLAEIDAQGELDNTIIAYVADHGDFAGEHGLMLKNLGIYESVHRIPFLLAGPGVPQGKVRDSIVEGVDFYPMLAGLAGLACEPEIDGLSQRDVIESDENGRPYAICEWEFLSPQSIVYAVRDDRFRYVRYEENPGDGELYDLCNDPGELRNLFHDSTYQSQQTQMAEVLNQYLCGGVQRICRFVEDHEKTLESTHFPTGRLHKCGAKWSGLVSGEADQKTWTEQVCDRIAE